MVSLIFLIAQILSSPLYNYFIVNPILHNYWSIISFCCNSQSSFEFYDPSTAFDMT